MEQAIGSFNDYRMPFEWNVDSLVTSCKAKAYRYRFSNREAVSLTYDLGSSALLVMPSWLLLSRYTSNE
jgi:hypothetical protein